MTKKLDVWEEGASVPDYEFWRRAAYWTIDEAVALICGKDPRNFIRENLINAPSGTSCVDDFFFWSELAGRAVKMGDLHEEVRPVEFLEWRLSIGSTEDEMLTALLLQEGDAGNPLNPINYRVSYLALSDAYAGLQNLNEELREQIGDYDDLVDYNEVLQDSLEAHPKPKRMGMDERQKKSLLKICLSIAISKYRFDPRTQKSSVAKNIEQAVLEAGLTITGETIRSLLREAIATFPEVLKVYEDE